MAKSPSQGNSSKHLVDCIVRGIQEKKGLDITILDLRDIKNAIVDYFVVCSGTSDRHVEALIEAIADQVKKERNENPWFQEGKGSGEWALIDFIDVVSHVFKKDKRAYYGLEELWGDAKVTTIDN